MGLSSFFRRFKSCFKGDSEYHKSHSYKSERISSTDDFLKKPAEEESDDSTLNEKSSNSNDSNKYLDMNDSNKYLDVNDSILSEENINQLRRRNPKLSRFDNDVIRLSLRKSLYATNFEEDLENFIREQQRETQKFENSDPAYSLSDLRELYDLINNIALKDLGISSDFESFLGKNKIKDQNIDISEESNEKSCSGNNSTNNDKNTQKFESLKSSNSIEKKENSNKEDDNKYNSFGLSPKYTNNKTEQQNNLLSNSPEQSYVEIVSTSKIGKASNININPLNSPGLTYSEIYQQSNNETLENSNNILCSTVQQNYSEIENQPQINGTVLNDSPKASINNEGDSIPYQNIKNEENNNNNKNNNIICEIPNNDYIDNNIICESPKDSFINNDNIFCQSPKDEYNDDEIMCQSSVDEYSKDNKICASPEQSYAELKSNIIDNDQSIICASPQQSFSDTFPLPEYDYNNKKHNNIASMPQQSNNNGNFQSSTENSPKPVEKLTTGFGYDNPLNNYGSFKSLRTNNIYNNIPYRNNQGSAPALHNNDNRDHLFSQLKMTEISKKDDVSSPGISSILGTAHSIDTQYKNSLYSKHSTINSGTSQSIYSYDNMDSLSSRKITKRGLKLLNSRDTLNIQKPINLKKRDRKALLIGINYTGKPYQLNGCINDANCVLNFLIRNYDFKRENCKIMKDDSEDKTLIPTKENIINAMKWLVEDAKEGDSLFFHYSGHGLSIKDEDGDEIDGMDESILPLDYEENGVILDDLIHDIMVKPLPKGCLLTALTDCCHSGTVLDLPYTYKYNGEIEDITDIDEEEDEIKKEYLSNEVYNKNKMVHKIVNKNSTHSKLSLTLEERKNIDKYAKKIKYSEADVIQFSSCRDNEISADEKANGNTYGALCNAFISTLNNIILEEKCISYVDLLMEIRKMIKKKYGQTPQISSSRPMDINKYFEL